jgi:glycosyltransferase involved in cell wall biosynthesis
MRILFLSRWFPYPADNGAKIRVFNILKGIATRHTVHLVSFASDRVTADHMAEMRRYCAQVDVVPYRLFQAGSLKAKLGFLSPIPRSFLDTFSAEYQNLVEQAGQKHHFDLVLASQWDTIPYMLGAPSLNDTPKLLEEVEISIYRDQMLRARGTRERLRKRAMWRKWRYFMSRSLPRINGCTVVSEPEIAPILECAPGYAPITIIPNGADIEHFTGDFGTPEPNTIVYTGAMTYHVNFDAMQWFLGEIWPLVLREVPQAKLFICGRYDNVPVHELPRFDNVTLLGHLPDIRPRIAQSWLSIVPERLGGGTRIKIPEAMALGTPIVSTKKGAQGLHIQPNQDLLVADQPQDFAQAIVRILNNPSLRQQLSQHGRATVVAKYDWRMIANQLNDFIVQIARASATNK